MKKLLFIPCYNDLDNLYKLLNEIKNIKSLSSDILIVNDGSFKKVKFLKKYKNIKIINLKSNFGIGFCLKLAINYAINNHYTKFCRIDSDGEHNPKYINQIFKILDKKDYVFGNRKILFKQNLFKLISKKVINFIINKTLNLKINDYNCGMMGFNLNVMQKIKKENFIKYPEPQIIFKLMKLKFKHSIIEIDQRKRLSGTSSINFFGGLDFFLITLFFLLNHVLNNSDD